MQVRQRLSSSTKARKIRMKHFPVYALRCCFDFRLFDNRSAAVNYKITYDIDSVHCSIHTRTRNKMRVWCARMIRKIKYTRRSIQSTLSIVDSLDWLDVYCIHSQKAAFAVDKTGYHDRREHMFSLDSKLCLKLSCVGFCSSCTFDYFADYFTLSRNGSLCFRMKNNVRVSHTRRIQK